MDSRKTEQVLVKKIKQFFSEQGRQKAVLGLSGGIDSAVVLVLLCKSLGPKNITCILMPNTKITKKSSTQDAEALTKKLGAKYFVVPIDVILESFEQLPWEQSGIAKANLNARARALVLYNYANSRDCLVAGTGNKTEFYLGYFTKYGDGAADFFPIGALLKKEVMELGKHLRIGREFLDKAPSAELYQGQEDEKELGLSYDVIDELLPLILQEEEIPEDRKEAAEKIASIIKATDHKREQPAIISLDIE